MTVGELKVALAYYPHDREIVLSSDEEGNGFLPLRALGDGEWVELQYGDDIEQALIFWP